MDNKVKSNATDFMLKKHVTQSCCLLFFLYSSLGCLNSRLKVLRWQVTQKFISLGYFLERLTRKITLYQV